MTEQKKKHCSKKWEDFSLRTKVLIIIAGIIAGAGLLTLFGFITMWLWNALMPKLFGLPGINYWEAWGIVILSKILLGGFRGHGGRVYERSSKRHLRDRIRKMDDNDTPEGKTVTD
jgi:hypothetical protein